MINKIRNLTETFNLLDAFYITEDRKYIIKPMKDSLSRTSVGRVRYEQFNAETGSHLTLFSYPLQDFREYTTNLKQLPLMTLCDQSQFIPETSALTRVLKQQGTPNKKRVEKLAFVIKHLFD